MNGKITFIETVGPNKGQCKTFTESFARDVMFDKIFKKLKWEQIEANVVPEDKERARELYEIELAQLTSLTNFQICDKKEIKCGRPHTYRTFFIV